MTQNLVSYNSRTNPIPKDLMGQVYCTGIANSTEESEWNTTVERYKSATCPIEQDHLLRGLSCTGNVTLLKR